MDMILGILINIILLLGLTLVVSLSDKKTELNKRYLHVLYGVIIGFFAIFIMMNAWTFDEGAFYDTRSILISNTAFFFHPITSTITTIIALIYRISVGGIGMPAGVLTILSSFIVGLVFKKYFYKKTGYSKYIELYGFAIVVHIFMILSQLAFPYPTNLEIVRDISLFVLVAYPIGSLLLGFALINNNQRIENMEKLEANNTLLQVQKERYQQLSYYSDSMVWEMNLNALITYVDEMIEPIFNLNASDVINKKHYFELIAKDHRLEISKVLLNTIDNEKTFNNLIFKFIRPDNEIVWISSSGFPMYDAEGKCIGYRGSDKNITKQIEQASLLEETENKYQIIFDQNPLGMIQYNEKGEITLANKQFADLLKSTVEQIKGLKMMHLPDKKLVAALKRSLNGELGLYQDYYRAVTSDAVAPVRVQFVPIKNKDNLVVGGIGIVENLTDYLKSREEIKKLSTTDSLTGLLNRRMFDEHFVQLNETNQLPFAVVLCDVNTLRIINESFGFEKGDFVLLEVAKALNDVKDNDNLLFRIGGDEFAILKPNASQEQIEKYIEKVKYILDLGNHEFPINVSFGYSLKTDKETSLEDAFKQAEHMMQSNKIYDGASISKKTIDIIMQTLFEKSSREMFHSQRVSALSEEIAMHFKLGTSFKNRVKIAGLLHDIGKINIDGGILNKPGKLTEEEWTIIKKHPEYGFRILNAVDEYIDIAGIVLNHHERWDGLGYPRKIKANKIPLESRIIAVADAYDAMTKDRLYRPALTKDEAIAEIQKNAGSQFDPKVVDIFIHKVLAYKDGESNGH